MSASEWRVGFRQCTVWLHQWAGLVVGWVLFFVFLTGTAGYFYYEITRWMQPERPLVTEPANQKQALAAAERRLRLVAPEARQWLIQLPGLRDSSQLGIAWRTASGSEDDEPQNQELIDAASGKPLEIHPRLTGGGRELYVMHWRLRYMPQNWGIWIVGACTMFMLVAIVSGVIAHKRIFRDFFTFRPRKGQRSWLDSHNVLSVLALPYHLMITYSGLVFYLIIYMPWGVTAAYGSGAERAFNAEAYARNGAGSRPVHAPAPTPLAPLGPMLAEAEKRWGNDGALRVTVNWPGDARATATISRDIGAHVARSRDVLRFDGVSGRLLVASGREPLAFTHFHQVLLGLHEGLFGGATMRWLFFLCGLCGTAMVATGLILWTVKRRESAPTTVGLPLVERLNVGTIAGLPVAIAAYFWANRLIPADFAERANWEIHTLFIVWGLMFLYPIMRPVARAWIDELALAALAFALLPLVNFLTTERHLGITLPAGDWVLAGFDLTVFVVGLLFAVTAWKVRRANSRAPAR